MTEIVLVIIFQLDRTLRQNAPQPLSNRTQAELTHHDIVVGDLEEVGAALRVGKLTDAEAIGGVQLLHEEGTAGLHHLRQLDQARRRQQALHCVLLQLNATYINKHGIVSTVLNVIYL